MDQEESWSSYNEQVCDKWIPMWQGHDEHGVWMNSEPQVTKRQELGQFDSHVPYSKYQETQDGVLYHQGKVLPFLSTQQLLSFPNQGGSARGLHTLINTSCTEFAVSCLVYLFQLCIPDKERHKIIGRPTGPTLRGTRDQTLLITNLHKPLHLTGQPQWCSGSLGISIHSEPVVPMESAETKDALDLYAWVTPHFTHCYVPHPQ